MYLISLVYLCASFSNTRAAKILGVFPTPSISHQVVFNALIRELTLRGHENVVITPNPAYPQHNAPENLTEVDVHDISYKIWRKLTSDPKITSDPNYGDEKYMLKLTNSISELFLTIFEQQAATTEVREIIEKNNGFDVLLVEAVSRCALGYSHVVKAPVIAVSSFRASPDNYYIMGAPLHPLLYPETLASHFYKLPLWKRMGYCYGIYSMLNSFKIREINENVVVKRIFGNSTPDISEIQNDIDMLLINVHRLWEGCRPMPPAVIHLGGVHLRLEEELPQDLKQYLDSSVNGIIYLSFGSNVDTSALPADKIQVIINVLSRLPYDVLWKWNQDELPGRTANIRIEKWLPQPDLLRHPKIKLFITQGGQQSTDETIAAGVPVIGIPMVLDQFYNTQKYEDYNIGKRIYFDNLSEETLMHAITTVINNMSYRENVIRLRTLMNDEPMSARARAAWWVEHVARRGGARHLRAPAAGMSWTDYYELELILLILSISSATMTLFLCFLCKIFKKCYSLLHKLH